MSDAQAMMLHVCSFEPVCTGSVVVSISTDHQHRQVLLFAVM